MELSELSFENYKAFHDRQTIEIRPLTVLIGRNNSGKSVISRLPLLVGRALSASAEGPFELEFDGLDFGASYVDLIHNRIPHGAIEVGVSVAFGGDVQWSFLAKIQHYIESRLLIVSHFELRDSRDQTTTLIWRGADPVKDGTRYRVEEAQRECNVWFKGLFPARLEFDGGSGIGADQLGQRILDAKRCFSEAFSDVTYLGPFREQPQRRYRYSGGKPPNVGRGGGKAPQLLGDDRLRRQGKVLQAVGQWYGQHFGGWRLDVTQEGDSFSIVLRNAEAPSVEINLADVGAGIAQVLPIVVQRHLEASPEQRRSSGRIEIVEQPELHLHPAAHGPLADLYVEAVKQSGVRFILETHSENFVLRLRRRVAERNLDPSNLVIYWIDDLNPSARIVRRINVDHTGEVDTWPQGVFYEDFEELRHIRMAQKKVAE